MSIKSNAHTHTTFCDGKNTAEEMVCSAISLGFTSLGFSSHSECVMGSDFLNATKIVAYKAEIARLKIKYKSEIIIHTGIEQDSLTKIPADGYDYIVGSVHFAIGDGGQFYAVDYAPEDFERGIKEGFRGDAFAFVTAYFSELDRMLAETKLDICGHFDLITKFNENNKYFDENCDAYRALALPIIKKYAQKVIFEINTGGIFRGYRKTPYPARFILDALYENGAKIMINSDSHSVDSIDFHFDEALALAKEVGFQRISILGADGFEEIDI